MTLKEAAAVLQKHDTRVAQLRNAGLARARKAVVA
jgi:hypothetical protein